MSLTIGVDIGATKIASGVVDDQGRVTTAKRRETRAPVSTRDLSVIVDALLDEVRRGGADVEAVGVAVPDLVDEAGRLLTDTVIGFDRETLIDSIGLPVVVESDVRAAAIAEARLGAGRRFRQSFFYVSIGTGVSGCLLINGTPHRGASGRAIVMTIGARRDGRWRVEDVESFGSGPALARTYLSETAHAIPAEKVVELASDGDNIARKVVEDGASATGSGIASIVNLLDPEGVVVGGGLGSARGPYWDALQTSVRAGIWWSSDDLILTQADLAEPGLVGAAIAARSHLTEEP